MIVTIDGPAGAGKSSVARLLADRLGFQFLDTGAMYRAVVLAALRAGLDFHNSAALRDLAGHVEINLDAARVYLDGEDVTDSIRAPEVGRVIHFVADDPAIRSRMVYLQRELADQKDMVCEGRDQGTVAFPNAACKVFLTASPEERARRRCEQLKGDSNDTSLEVILNQQNERDQRDMDRPVGALVKADDAVEVCTDGLSLDEVVSQLQQLVEQRRS